MSKYLPYKGLSGLILIHLIQKKFRKKKPRINKKVPGKFKDGFNRQIMTEFVGLRSNLCSFRVSENEKEIKKAKGVKKTIVKNELCFNDFYSC